MSDTAPGPAGVLAELLSRPAVVSGVCHARMDTKLDTYVATNLVTSWANAKAPVLAQRPRYTTPARSAGTACP